MAYKSSYWWNQLFSRKTHLGEQWVNHTTFKEPYKKRYRQAQHWQRPKSVTINSGFHCFPTLTLYKWMTVVTLLQLLLQQDDNMHYSKRWESLPRVNLLKVCQCVSTIGKTLVKAMLMERHHCSLKTDLGQKFSKKVVVKILVGKDVSCCISKGWNKGLHTSFKTSSQLYETHV